MKVWIAVLSIIGGIAGIVSGFLVTAGGTIFNETEMASSGASVFWVSILAVFLGFLSWIPKVKRLSGIALLIIAIYGFIANGLFFTFAFVFLVIAGCLATFTKPHPKQNESVGA